MDPLTAISAGTEAISLLSALGKLLDEAKKQPDKVNTPLRELLDRLRIDAIRLSRDLELRVRNLVERVEDYGLKPEQTLSSQLASLQWYNILTRSRFKSFREECNSIYRELTGFLDDATALLLCDGQATLAGPAFTANLEMKRKLDSLLLDKNTTVRHLLDNLLETASKASADLQA
jgi:hypothetical protein